jgi:hypothetical protein
MHNFKSKFKTLVTLNLFTDKAETLQEVKDYRKFLKGIPKRTDFINFDDDGYELNDNQPLFKGWSVCEDSSSETIKVAKLKDCRIYFDTADGVIVVNETNMTDNATYNELAIFFDSKLKLS